MAVFTYSRVPAFNPNTTPVSVARSATGNVYDLGDTGFTTPLNLTLVATNTVTTTLVSDANGMFPDFTLVDRTSVVFKSGSNKMVLTTTTPIPGPASTVPGPQGPPGPATTDASLLVAGTVSDARLPARLQDAALSATYAPVAGSAAYAAKSVETSKLDVTTAASTYVPKWKPTTAYLAGDKVLSPAGDVVSAKVNFTSGATFNAVNWNQSSTTAATKSSIASLNEVHAPAVISLIGGQPDETLTVTNCTATADTVNKRFGVQSWKLTMAGAVTATAKLSALTAGGAINEPISGVGLMIYVPDVTKVTGLTVQLYTGVADTDFYNFNITGLRLGLAGNLKTGWNIVRWTPSHKTITGSPLAFGNIDHVRVVVVTNAATDVSVQQLFIQRRPKASILFIHDGGYNLWDQSPGYFDLRDRNVPVTWSVDTGLIGDVNHVTDARLREIGAENRNSISFHGWDGTDTTSMTAAQCQAHTMKAIKWLAVRGFTGRIWRSAWLQNSAPNAEATNDMVLVNPMFGTEGQERIQSWPFHDRYGVSRIALQGKTEAGIDAIFDELKANHGVAVLYTHRVRDGFAADITPAMWTYFLAKYDIAVAEGWLEAVTLEMLLESSGVKIRQGMGGAWAAEWPNVDGTTTLKPLP